MLTQRTKTVMESSHVRKIATNISIIHRLKLQKPFRTQTHNTFKTQIPRYQSPFRKKSMNTSVAVSAGPWVQRSLIGTCTIH